MTVLVWPWIALFRLPQRVAATDSISKRDSNGAFSDPPKQIAFTVCIVVSIAGVLAVGVYALVAGRRRKTSDDPELGSAATGSNDNLLPYNVLQRQAPLTGILVSGVDTSKRRSSRSRRSQMSFIQTSLESIPEHEQWQFCSCSDSNDDGDDTLPSPDSFYGWYLDYRHRVRSKKNSIMAGHTGNRDEAEPSALPSHEEGDTTGLRDFVDVSPRRVDSTSRAFKRRRRPIRHHDTGPIASTDIYEQSTYLDQVPPPILRQDDAEPSVTQQPADMSRSASAIARTA